MKKKSPRGIPNFSRQASPSKDAGKTVAGPVAKEGAVGPPPPRPKPKSTNAKSGQRGR